MEILHTARVTLILAFLALPLLLVSFTAFLAIGLGNMGLFILFMGQAFIVPMITGLFNWVVRSRLGPSAIPPSDIGQLVPSALITSSETNPSYWMAHVLFFLGYLLANAVDIYSLPVDSSAPEWQVRNRKMKAATVMSVIMLLLIVLPLLRKIVTGTETWFGIAIAFATCGTLGYGWYQFAAQCGARASDVFGIIQQMPPKSDSTPTTCVYAPKA
jgi:hypothetical protein